MLGWCICRDLCTLRNQNFRTKWISILNKCSFDLMLLIIEESLKETNKIAQDITNLEENLKKSSILRKKWRNLKTKFIYMKKDQGNKNHKLQIVKIIYKIRFING